MFVVKLRLVDQVIVPVMDCPCLIDGKSVVLEEFEFTRAGVFGADVANWIAGKLLPHSQAYEATRKRAQDPKQPRFRWEAEQLHDYVLFSANTGLRPDEAMRLQFRDVTTLL